MYIIEDLRNVIVQSPQKLCTLDPLPRQLLMTSLNSILSLLHIICNRSLCEGTLPDSEKLALVTSIVRKAGLDINCASTTDLYQI